MENSLILITGATGYVGRRLLAALESKGQPVRCLVRDPKRLSAASPATQILEGDALSPGVLDRAMAGVDTAYYLMHSMGSAGPFAALERQAALLFAQAARAAGVRRVFYL